MQLLFLFCFVLCVALSKPSVAYASAFVPAAGHGQIIAALGYGEASVRRWSAGWSTLLFEYGLMNNLALIAKPGVGILPYHDPQTRGEFQANGQIGVKARLWCGDDYSVSAQTSYLQPSIVRDGFLASGPPVVETRMMMGKAFRLGGTSLFFDAEGALLWRNAGTANEWRLDATLGAYATNRLLLLTQFFNAGARGTAYWNFDSRSTRHADFWVDSKAQFSLVYALTQSISLQSGVYRTIYRRNATQDTGATLAVWIKF